ncbi:hypothetical protein CCMA1212_001472 [Trichoderma ghanense]|uniref:Uncharacterized protein n=1 Tax=Trichoderma ghanense TaxID=65468 RepID=A0ABY2HDF6_9HYPO
MSLAVNRSSSGPSPALLLKAGIGPEPLLSVSTVYGGSGRCQVPQQSLPQQATVFVTAPGERWTMPWAGAR